jgi:16S rRNA (cytidine1402-2'-O)-methyltransferase
VARLIVVPTPIGNLEDITLRALRELRGASLILAEDTRHTRKLLSHFGIGTPMLSYHEHNRRSREERVLEALKQGDVALVSDAGMPGISDPGADLVAIAIKRGIEVDVLPGPSAAPTAAVLAGFGSPGYVFVGFLPRRGRERIERIEELATLRYPIVLYEAPHRVRRTLKDLRERLGDRPAIVARELTKIHQEVVRGTLTELLDRFEQEDPRGEFSIVVGPFTDEPVDRTEEARSDMARTRRSGLDRRSAVEHIVSTYQLSRNDAYRLWVEAEGKL